MGNFKIFFYEMYRVCYGVKIVKVCIEFLFLVFWIKRVKFDFVDYFSYCFDIVLFFVVLWKFFLEVNFSVVFIELIIKFFKSFCEFGRVIV